MLTIKYPIPERCLLAQAAIYVMYGRLPIPDEIFLAAPTAPVVSADELIRALRAGALTAQGNLYDAFRGGSYESFEGWRKVSHWPLEEDLPIARDLWSSQNCSDLSESSLFASDAAIWCRYKGRKFLSDEVFDKTAGFLFCEITISTSDLFSRFPAEAMAVTNSASLAPETPSPRRAGRPPKYDWDRFFAELIVRADLDGLPATQAELVSQMANWCLENWGEQPADSVLKERTAAIFNHPRKSMQQKPEIRTNRFPAIPS
jgi:hypothetical protein